MKIEWNGSEWGGTFIQTAVFMLRDLASDGVPTTVKVLEVNDGRKAMVARTVTYVEVGNTGYADTLVGADGSVYELDGDRILSIEVI